MSETQDAMKPADVLSFWRAAGPDKWFAKDDAFDAEIRARFLPTYEAAAAGRLTWDETPEGALALVIVLDQFPRNMFRNSARAFAADPLAREDLAFALAVILLGLLLMVTRRNAVSQVIGFMSLENGLVLAATGAKGMPLVVEVSVAFSVLISLFVFAVFVFRIRERFDTIDIEALDRMRGDRR